jgi:hypothetical protein
MHFGDLLKHSRPGHHQHKIELPACTKVNSSSARKIAKHNYSKGLLLKKTAKVCSFVHPADCIIVFKGIPARSIADVEAPINSMYSVHLMLITLYISIKNYYLVFILLEIIRNI